MKVGTALVLLAACSGGDGEPVVDIDIVTATCRSITSGLVVDAELDAGLGVGESLEIVVDSSVAGASRISEVWDCGDWQFSSSTFGCVREAEIQAPRQTVTVMHTRIYDAPQEPPTQIVVSPVLVVGNGGHVGTGVDLTCAP